MMPLDPSRDPADAESRIARSGSLYSASEAAEPQNPRLLAAVREYMDALDAGLRPSRREFAARYPDIADELSTCLDGLAFVHSAAHKLHPSPDPFDHGFPETPSAKALGDFRLIRELGRGGMGIVYEAEQLSLGRRVAVKVLPFAAALDPRHLQRFRNEAQAAAQLHHTNIVPVYAVGCERSVHYYAMQLIDGQSLAAVLRQLRQLAATVPALSQPTTPAGHIARTHLLGFNASKPAATSSTPAAPAEEEPLPNDPPDPTATSLAALRSSSPRGYYQSVAKLGQQAAEALDYAHQVGVVHRDIKPGNLLLDTRGNLWITDFGLAQFYRENELTQTGDLIGTLAYMSPEQASGKAVVLDQRADVFSLGVTLYELLTLRRAFDGTSREEVLRQVCEKDPTPPRDIDKRIPHELEVILQKATAKEPAERYQSAQLLADDLKRFLHDEPIRARPPTRWEKTVKWTRRHRSLALAGLGVLLLIAGGLLTTTILIAREQKKTEQRAIEAERNFDQAKRAVDFFATVAEQEMAGKPPFTDIRRELLERAVTYYQTLLKQRTDVVTQAGLHAAQDHVDSILRELKALEDFSRVASRVTLLLEPSVQNELQLTGSQIADARKLAGGFENSRPFDDRAADTDRQKFAELGLTADAALRNRLLTPSQFTRLCQIARQVRGLMVYNDSEIQSALAMSPYQKSTIRRILDNFREQHFRHHGPPDQNGDAGPNELDDQLSSAFANAESQVNSCLSQEQRSQMNTLLGPAFTGEIYSHDMFGMPPQHHGGRRGGPPLDGRFGLQNHPDPSDHTAQQPDDPLLAK